MFWSDDKGEYLYRCYDMHFHNLEFWTAMTKEEEAASKAAKKAAKDAEKSAKKASKK